MGKEDHSLFPLVLENLLPKQGPRADWVKEPSRQQGRGPSLVGCRGVSLSRSRCRPD